MIVELSKPYCVNEIAFLIIRRLLPESCLRPRFLDIGVLLSQGEEAFFFLRLDIERTDSHWLFRVGIQRYHRKGAGHEHILLLGRGPFLRRFGYLNRYLHAASAGGEGDLAGKLEVTEFRQGMVDGNTINRSRYSCHGFPSVLVGNHAGQSIKIHEKCTESAIIRGFSNER